MEETCRLEIGRLWDELSRLASLDPILPNQ